MNRRVVELDGVRGIAVLLVLLWHYVCNQLHGSIGTSAYWAQRLLGLTWSGVDLFFVLSGFLIVGILVQAQKSASYFTAFYIRRACRIVPLYLLLVVVFAVIARCVTHGNAWLFEENLPLASYFTFTQNFFMHSGAWGSGWLSVTWSLAVEEQFYLLIPFIIRYLDRRRISLLLGVAVLAAPLVRMINGGVGAYVLPFARCDSILLGGLLALVMSDPQVASRVRCCRSHLHAAFVVLLLGAGVITIRNSAIGDPFNHFWLAMLYGVFVLMAVQQEGWLCKFLRNRILVWFGTRSYAIYLFHQPVSGLVHQRIGTLPPSFDSLPTSVPTVLSFVLVLVLAEISFWCIEKPFLRLGQRFRYDVPATPG